MLSLKQAQSLLRQIVIPTMPAPRSESNPPAQGIDEREAFETWVTKTLYGHDLERDESGTGYSQDATDVAWSTWQARAAFAQVPGIGGERAAFEADYLRRHDSRLYCESEWRGWQARAAQAPAAEPLTAEQIDELVTQYAGYDRDDFRAVARAVERAHGIKETT